MMTEYFTGFERFGALEFLRDIPTRLKIVIMPEVPGSVAV